MPPLSLAVTIDDIFTSNLIGEPKKVRCELDNVVHESLAIYNFLIDQLKPRVSQIGRQLVVVGNQSYGELAVLPIKGLLKQQGIDVYLFKIPSRIIASSLGEIFNHPENMPEDFLSLLRFFVTEQPIVAVIDSTATPASGTYARVPRAVLTYCDILAGVNLSIQGKPRVQTIGGPVCSNTLVDIEHTPLMRKLDSLRGEDKSRLSPYELTFWNPDELDSEYIGKSLPLPYIDVMKITNPTMVYMTSTARLSSADDKPGFFDNKLLRLPVDAWGKIKGLEEYLAASLVSQLSPK